MESRPLFDLLDRGHRDFGAAGNHDVLDGVQDVQPGAELPRELAPVVERAAERPAPKSVGTRMFVSAIMVGPSDASQGRCQ